MAKKSLKVEIAGAPYKVRSDADETYLRTLASFVDEKIREVRQSSRASSHESAVLAALNIADDLFQERRKREGLKQQVRERSVTLLSLLDKEEKRLLGHDR